MSPTGRVQTKDHNLDQDTLERVLELTDGENLVQYLGMDTPDTALGIIAWIDDPKRIAGWRLTNQEFCNPPLEIITDALDKQQRALEADATLPVYHEVHFATARLSRNATSANRDTMMSPRESAVRSRMFRKEQPRTALERTRRTLKKPNSLLQNLQLRMSTPGPDYNTARSWSSIAATARSTSRRPMPTRTSRITPVPSTTRATSGWKMI